MAAPSQVNIDYDNFKCMVSDAPVDGFEGTTSTTILLLFFSTRDIDVLL